MSLVDATQRPPLRQPIMDDKRWFELRDAGQLSAEYRAWLNKPLTATEIALVEQETRMPSPLSHFDGHHSPFDSAWALRLIATIRHGIRSEGRGENP